MRGRIWRAVEAQHHASTRRITTTQAEQSRLEELLEHSKPPVPAAAQHLHYLLQTPFRYRPPWPRGSRFRPAHAPWGIFYASEHRRGALAEFGHGRRQFFLASRGTRLPRTEEQLTVFAVRHATGRGLDLTAPPLDRDRHLWVDAHSYDATQALAREARTAGVQALRSESVRDPERGCNVSVFDPGVFVDRAPIRAESWRLHLGAVEIVASRAMATGEERYVFSCEPRPVDDCG